MAIAAHPNVPAIGDQSRPDEISAKKAQEDFLASVMVSVSASLEAMSEEERERAVTAAEQAVAHFQ